VRVPPLAVDGRVAIYNYRIRPPFRCACAQRVVPRPLGATPPLCFAQSA